MKMNRKAYIDYIKAIGIILVILGHINFANQVIKGWIYAFHMPLFFFASGLVLKPIHLNMSYFEKKFTQLIAPYILWGMIYCSFSFGNTAKILYGSYHTITNAESLSSLWFLPAMFLAVLISLLILKVTEKRLFIGMAAVILFLAGTCLPKIDMGYPWCVDVSLIAASFILLGYLTKNKSDDFSNRGGLDYYIDYFSGFPAYTDICF